jgi:hypothetical protein
MEAAMAVPCGQERHDWYTREERDSARSYEYEPHKKHQGRLRRTYAHILAERRLKEYQRAFFRALEEQVAPQAEQAIAAKAKLEADFFKQAEKWDRETAHMSSPLQKMMHPSYQAILGMSAESAQNKRDIIRFMLHDLKTSHREWSLALSYLTQHNPINPKDYGKTDKINAAWIRWGEDEGRL